MENTIDVVQSDERKPYAKPEILHELDLETRAGSLIGNLDLFDLENQ